MKKSILLFSIFFASISALNAQSDTTIRTISFKANTVYFLNGLLLNTNDEDLRDLAKKWYKQCNVSNPPTGNTVVSVQTDAETVLKLSGVVRQFPFRLISNLWTEITSGINNAAAGYQPLIDRLAALDSGDVNDRQTLFQAGKKDAQGKL